MNANLRTRLLPALGAILVPLVFALGCGEEEQVDPYTYATLRAVTHGHAISKDFLFEIDAPEFVLTHGNTGIIRNGNQLEIMVADDLENRAANFQGKLIGVQKFFSPVVWLMAKRVKDGLNVTSLDSVPDPVLPKFTSPNLEEVPGSKLTYDGEYATVTTTPEQLAIISYMVKQERAALDQFLRGFDLGKLRWNQKESMEDIVDSELQGVGVVFQREDHELIEDYDAEADTTGQGPPMAWYLRAKDSDATFKLDNVTQSLELAFHLLEAEGLPFVGSVTVHDPYPFRQRRESRISAPMSVNWLRYANRFLAP